MIEPTEQEIRNVAFEFWQMRRGADGYAAADWYMAIKWLRLVKNYERIIQHDFVTAKKTFLGPREDRRCRFCGRGRPETTFSDRSHAVPELLGNRSIIARYECDACNQRSSRLEDELGKLTLPVRTFLQIRGKKGIPTFESNSHQTRIETPQFGRFEIRTTVGEGIVELDPDNKQIIYRIRTPSFVAIAAFKSLTKAALALMPEPETQYFPDAIRWVMDLDHNSRPLPIKPVTCLYALTPGPFPPAFGRTMLFRRLDDAASLPYMMLVLETANLTLQIPLVLCERDVHMDGGKMIVPVYPAGIGLGFDFGEPEYKRWDLSSTSPRAIDVTLRSHVEHMDRL